MNARDECYDFCRREIPVYWQFIKRVGRRGGGGTENGIFKPPQNDIPFY